MRGFVAMTVALLFSINSAAAEPLMYAHSINVGQGAATFLEFPCGCMLIDTGAQDEAHVDHLVEYLQGVFERRPDLQSTIDVLIITHPHKDHTWGLESVARTFNIRTYVDNGVFATGSGKGNVKVDPRSIAVGHAERQHSGGHR
jgi:competence protein ComEC